MAKGKLRVVGNAARRARSAAAGKKTRPLLTAQGLPGGDGLLRLTGLTAREEISCLYEVLLEVEPSPGRAVDPGELARRAMGADVSVSLRLDGCPATERFFHGRIAAVTLDEEGGSGEPCRLLLHLRPRLWWLSRTVRTRLFTGKTARQVVTDVLQEHGLGAGDCEWRLAPGRTLAPRPFCWQFREDDLTFVGRLLEEEGLAYWFEFSASGHRLVIGDSPAAYPECRRGAPVPLRGPARDDGMPGPRDDAVTSLRHEWQVTPAGYARHGRPFESPDTEVEGAAGSRRLGASGTVTEGAAAAPAAETRRASRARMDAIEASACRVSGAGHVRAFTAGQVVAVAGRSPGAPPRRLLLTAVRHDVQQAKAIRYHNFFEAVPADLPYAPPPRHPRPVVAGALPAVVDSRPDRHGRVKVRFDLDRRRGASAWVPLAHPAHAVFFPRPGRRVAVHFLEGDPDQPVVGPCLDNADGLPFDPSAHPERGCLVTPHHALWADDADELRRVLLHVGGRLEQLVEGDRTTIIDRDDRDLARGSRYWQTERDLRERIGGDVSRTADGSCAQRVGKAFALDAGEDIHLVAGRRIVLEVAGSYVVIDASGIWINGAPLLRLNSKQSATKGTPVMAQLPQAAKVEPPPRKRSKA